MIQDVVWTVSIVLMGALAGVFAWVAVGANVALADYGPVIASAYRWRAWLFALAVVILIVANYRTLGELPYASGATLSSTVVVQHVDAVAEQWSWSVTPSTFVVGQTAEFSVTSKDVNHGFALYGPQMRIVAQTQAMPGYVNVLRYTFAEPGTYQVMCLEYCGLAHHAMTAEIKVAAH
jgi:cytochrome c oxidase subunit 2